MSKFFKKKPVESKWDLRKSNSQVLNIEDKCRCSYRLPNGLKGIAKATVAFSTSFSYCELFITNGNGEKICFGLTNNDHPIDIYPGYFRSSYGYMGDGKIYGGTGEGKVYGPTFTAGDVIGCGYDSSAKTIFFTKNGVYLGSAFQKVSLSSNMYPTVGLQSPGEAVVINCVPPFSYRGASDKLSKQQVNNVPVASSNSEDLIPKEEFELVKWNTKKDKIGKNVVVMDRKAFLPHDSPKDTIGGIRATQPLNDSNGFCYFEVIIDNLERGQISIGLAQQEYPNNLHIGWIKSSYGYHSDDGRKFKCKEEPGVNEGEPYGESYKKGDVIGCGMNFKYKEIFFTKNGMYIGSAFSNVYYTLYPSVALSEPGTSIIGVFSPPFKFTQIALMIKNFPQPSFMLPKQQQPNITSTTTTTTTTSSSNIKSSNNDSIFNLDSSAMTTVSKRTSPPHSIGGGGSYNSLSSFSSLSSGPTSNSPMSSSTSIPPPPSHFSSLWFNGGGNESSNNGGSGNITNTQLNNQLLNRHCVSLPVVPSSSNNLTGLSMTFPSISPNSSPQVSPRKNLSSSDDLQFVQFQDDGQPPSAWRRCGKSIKMKDDNITLTMMRKKTSVAMADRPFSPNSPTTICYFEVYLEGHDKKGSITVGLSHSTYPFNKHIGREPKSYGYSSEGEKFGGSEEGEPYGPTFFGDGDCVIGCGINTSTKEIFFTKNGRYIGVAFWNVPSEPLYPSVSFRGIVGGICIATFHTHFKFNFEDLPGVSPSIWTKNLGPDRQNNGFKNWPPNDVGIWLEAINYKQYKKNFHDNNISGRHLININNRDLKNELKIEPFGHRDDILDRLKKMREIWNIKSPESYQGSEGSLMDDNKKSLKWRDSSNESEEETISDISHSGKITRPMKSYSAKEIEDRNRRSTIGGIEKKNKFFVDQDRTLADSMGSDDSEFIQQPDEKTSSKTLNQQQIRYLQQKGPEKDIITTNNPYNTFSPSITHPPQQKNSVSNSKSNNNNNNNSNSNNNFSLPPIIGNSGGNIPQIHHTFLQPQDILPTSKFYTQNSNNNVNVNNNPNNILINFKPIANANTNNSLSTSSLPQPQQQQQITSSSSVGQQQFQQSQSLSQQQISTPPPRFEYEIDFNELEFGPTIGKGFFGEVKKGYWRETDVAIKIIYRDQFKTKSSLVMFQNEVSILSKLRHPNVVQFLGACTAGAEEHHCIVTEWMGGGSLRQFLTDHFTILEDNPHLRLKIASDIAKGMCYLHGWTPAILHRDLSSRNILLDHSIDPNNPSRGYSINDFKSKISDFGLSRLKMEQGQSMTSSVGCIPYMAPEVFKGESNSEKSDVYSYGMILWELLTSDEPQQDMKPMKMAHLAAYESYRPPIPLTTPPKWKELLTQCWDTNPDKRPTFKQIIAHLKEMSEQGLSSFAPVLPQVIDTGVYA
ncbi:hypothetical protein DICPUDRAFT_53617 [Dictyostelium purpureum]|uniref:B30.2/SPRY domain-containing protein n=1 Tax=Dictyostelium purpureum TaxID=5786 RepID=F0ZDM8_DICPU|nr:uncharacterized protein DICPUDRAFT_53617 [Dictyostelium purpureum]EGC37943.1 hypothetical protein DICPUDRAFT_53617 [Dictyostelium purpureum]|eukprot:XP_003285514.1 hypothetical protein DICPUDRAFT_53617 [Dictyostelium purpureum]